MDESNIPDEEAKKLAIATLHEINLGVLEISGTMRKMLTELRRINRKIPSPPKGAKP